MKIAQDRQKSYADVRRRPLEFQVGEHVFLKVSPTKGVKRFGIKGKLSPRYIGPFEILAKVRNVAYKLALPSALEGVHNVFHISMSRKSLADPSEVIELPPQRLEKDLSYAEHPVKILDAHERKLRNSTMKFLKVQWSRRSVDEATWNLEKDLRKTLPALFEISMEE